MREFGELRRVNPRDIWPHEAADFTPWLADQIAELGKAIGIELELHEREAAVGDFSLDLLAEDLGTGRKVIIENQLEPTDHDHLGKLLTYASGFDAGVVIWVAREIREEHRQALDWLNQRTDSATHFFGVVVEVLQIDESRPAYNFKPVVSPNEWQKSKRSEGAGRSSAKADAYRQFFQTLIDELREKHNFTNARAGQPQSWYSFSSGIPGISYGASFAQGERARVEVYIDRGDAVGNKRLFDRVHQSKDVIEGEVGEKLYWERLDDKRASRVAVYRTSSINDSSDSLDGIRTWMIDSLLRFKQVFADRIKSEIAVNSTA